jgi:hypothetical protein
LRQNKFPLKQNVEGSSNDVAMKSNDSELKKGSSQSNHYFLVAAFKRPYLAGFCGYSVQPFH